MNPTEIVLKAHDYLKAGTNDHKRLDYYLNKWNYKAQIDNIPDLCKEMLHQAKNKQGMPNYIGEIANLSNVLFSFNPNKIINKYDSWGDVFLSIENSNVEIPGRMNKDNSKNSWVQYSKSIISISKYLSRFKNYHDFDNYIKQFIDDSKPDVRVALPLIFSQEIHGYGFALACSFLKENVSPMFIKPDTHVKYISNKLQIINSMDSDYVTYSKLIKFSTQAKKSPYWIDKAFFLIGKGSFYATDKFNDEAKISCSKQDFIKYIHKGK